MNYSQITKLSLRLFLGFLGLTAVVAVVSVLGGTFGTFQAKVIGTTFSISAASICAMSCAAFISRRSRSEAGLAGIGFAVAGAVLVIAGLWMETNSEIFWKTTATLCISAFCSAHAFLLILPDLGTSKNRWFRPVSFIAIITLAVWAIVALWGEIDNEFYYRGMAAVGIIVGLQTVSLPILINLNKSNKTANKLLLLTEQDDGLYKAADGIRYRVERIEA